MASYGEATDLTSARRRFLEANPAIAASDVVLLPTVELLAIAESFFEQGCVHHARVQAELRVLASIDGACAACQPRR